MLKLSIVTPVLLFLALCFTMSAFAEEIPSMHQIYLAAEAGKFNEAQSMMDKVLHDHPNSAKAHFVEAELLAKQGLFSKASDELNNAERLQPGLPFAKPEALKNLKSRIASATNVVIETNVPHQNKPTADVVHQDIPAIAKDWMPTVLLIVGIGVVVLLIGIMTRRNSRVMPANSYPGNAPSPSGVSGGGAVMGQPAAGGMGSGLMGSLATGAAMGAGVVAGEALMHHFTDGSKNSEPPAHDASPWGTTSNVGGNDDMGGTDFGIDDTSSWDDDDSGDSDSGDDWD